jgi:hypothetical protein
MRSLGVAHVAAPTPTTLAALRPTTRRAEPALTSAAAYHRAMTDASSDVPACP